MINLLTVLTVMTILGGALAVIGATLREHADAIVAALAGRSIKAAPAVAAPRLRVTVRTPTGLPRYALPLRAAA